MDDFDFEPVNDTPAPAAMDFEPVHEEEPAPQSGDVGNGLHAVNYLQNSWQDLAAGHIKAAEAGHSFGQTAPGEYGTIQGAPRKLSPSEKTAIYDAYRQQYVGGQQQETGQQAASDLSNVRSRVLQQQVQGQGFVRNVGNQALNTALQLGPAMVQAFAPGGPNDIQEGREAVSDVLATNPDSYGTMAGGAAASAGLAVLPGGLAATALGAAGDYRSQVMQARVAGRQISPTQELAGAAMTAANMYAMGKFTMSRGAGLTPALLQDMRQSVTKEVLKYSMSAGLGAEAMSTAKIVDNAIAARLGLDPNRMLTEGMPQAALTGGIMGPAMEAVGSYMKKPAPAEQPPAKILRPEGGWPGNIGEAGVPVERAVQPEPLPLWEQAGTTDAEGQNWEPIQERPPEAPRPEAKPEPLPENVGMLGPEQTTTPEQIAQEGQQMEQRRSDFERRQTAGGPPEGMEERRVAADRREALVRGVAGKRGLIDAVTPEQIAALKAGASAPTTEISPLLQDMRNEPAAAPTPVPQTGTNVPTPGTPPAPTPTPAPAGGGTPPPTPPATPTPTPAGTPAPKSSLLSNLRAKAAGSPAAQKIIAGWKSFNRALGTGLGRTSSDKDVVLNLREALGEHERTGAILDREIAPARDAVNKMTPAAQDAVIDQIEAGQGQADPNPTIRHADDVVHQMNAENAADAPKVGINTRGWNTDQDWVGRMFKPAKGQAATGAGSLAGTEAFRKAQNYDTYSQAKAAAAAHGLVPVFDNPMDMLVAKQMEVRKSIMARQRMYEEEDNGNLKWIPEKTKVPEGMAPLNDKVAQQERDLIAPKQVVGRAASMKHFDAERFLDSQQENFETLRPGDPMPEGMAKTGRTQRGTFHGDENVAQMFNSQMAERGTLGSVGDLAGSVSKWDTSMRFALSAFHAGTVSVGNFYAGLGNAIRSIAQGNVGESIRDLWESTPIGGALAGSKLREQLRNPSFDPSLEPVAAAVQATNPGLQLRAKRMFSDARDAFDRGDNQVGMLSMAKGAIHSIHDVLFKSYIPNLKASLLAQSAREQLANGTDPDVVKANMARAQDNAQNVLGQVMHSNQFQSKVLQRMMDIVMPTWKFSEGFIRHGAASARDIGEIAGSLMKGEKPNQVMTPALMTSAGIVAGTAVLSGAIQALATYIHKGKAELPQTAEDWISPRLGYTDDQGREKRLVIPGPAHFWKSAATKPENLVKNRLAGYINGTIEAAQNKDYRGTMIREEGDTTLQKIGETAAHIGKQSLPIAFRGQSIGSTSAAEKVSGFFGFRTAPGTASEAEDYAHQLIRERMPPRTKAETAHSDTMNQLAAHMRGGVNVGGEINDALRSKALLPEDISKVESRAGQEPGLRGVLQSSSLQPHELLQVWERMTPEEKRQNRFIVLGRIGRSNESADFTAEDKAAAFKQINEERP